VEIRHGPRVPHRADQKRIRAQVHRTWQLEEKIDQMIEDKKQLADSVVGADEAWLTELDNDAFKELIALNAALVLE